MSVDLLSSYEPLAPTGSSSLPNPTTEESGHGPVADPKPMLSPGEIITALYGSLDSLRSLVGDVETNRIVTGALAQQAHLDERSDGNYRLVLQSLLQVENQILVEKLARRGLPANALNLTNGLAPDMFSGGGTQSDSGSLPMLLLAVRCLRQRYMQAGGNGVAANEPTISDSQRQETVEESLTAPQPAQSMPSDDVLPPDPATAALTADSALATTEADGTAAATGETKESGDSTVDKALSALQPPPAVTTVDFDYLKDVHAVMLTLDDEFANLLDIEATTRQAVNNYLFAFGSRRKAACNAWFLAEFVKLVNAHLAVQERLDSLEETMALLRDHWSTLLKRHRRIARRIRRSGSGKVSKMSAIHLPMIKKLVQRYHYVRRAHFQLIPFVLGCYERARAKGWNHEDEGNAELIDHLESIHERWEARTRMKVRRGRVPQDKVLSSLSLSGEGNDEEDDALVASSQ